MKAKYLTLIGTALSFAVSGNVAVAQSTDNPTEIKLSPEGMEILCQRFPLNSRCAGSSAPTPEPAAEGPSDPNLPQETSGTRTAPQTAPSESTTPATPTSPNPVAPDTTTPGTMTVPVTPGDATTPGTSNQ